MRRFFLGMAIASLTAGAPLTAFGGDREIADAIITAVKQSQVSLKGLEVDLTVENGNVLITGTAASQAQLDRVLSAARDTEGVKSVDNQAMSLLELFLYASQRTQKYYDEEKLLATEQALLDDNGDGKGTPASFYRGMRAVKAPAEGASVDGLVARSLYWNQSDQNPDSIRNREEIAALEIKLETLRREKGAMSEEAYYRALEDLLLQIAPLHGLKPREKTNQSIGF